MVNVKNVLVTLSSGETARFDKAGAYFQSTIALEIVVGVRHYLFPWTNVTKVAYEEDNGQSGSTGSHPWRK